MKKIIRFLFILTAFALIMGTTACDEGNYGEDTTTSSGGGTGGGSTGGGETTDPTQLDTPGDILATDGDYTSKITITWSIVDKSSSYAVFKSDSAEGGYADITPEGGLITNSLTDTDVTPDIKYYYKVQALSTSDSYTASELSDADEGFARDGLATVTGVSATNGTLTDTIGLTWDEVPGATHYIVYRSSSASGAFEEIGEVAAVDLNSSTPEEPEPVHLDFTSNVDLNTYHLFYLFYPKRGVFVYPLVSFQLRIIIGSDIDETILFSGGFLGKVYNQTDIINKINDAVGFDLCSAAYGDDETIKYITMSVDNEPLIFQNYSNNRAIMFFLMSEVNDKDQMVIINGDGTTIIDESEYSGDPLDYVTTDDDSGDDGDDTGGDDNDDVSPYYYKDTKDLVTNQPYYYKIEAVERDEDGGPVRYSDLSEADSGYIGELQAPSVPENISATDEESNNSITITWNAVNNAEYYRVYISDLEDGEYLQIAGSGDITGTSYTYSTTSQGISYFKVRAYNLAGESGLSDYDEGSISHEAITNLEFLQLYIQTEASYQGKLPELPMSDQKVSGENGGTAYYYIQIAGTVTVTNKYEDYCDYSIIVNGENVSKVSLTSRTGTCTGTIYISGPYEGTIVMDLTVNDSGVTGGSYTVTQTGGGDPETINFSDL